jgi:hypothetical protein
MRGAILLAAMLLAGCGGGQPTAATTSVTSDGNTVTVATGGEAAAGTDCSAKPDFAPIYPGGTIILCNSAHMAATGKDAGSAIYRTSAAPATVLAWVKQQTAKSGLAPRIETASMFSAGEGNKRTIMTHVEAEGSGTRVVLNWGKAP